MGMADGRGGGLKKIEFVVGDRRFKFAINPENYVHSKPHRTTTIKTKSRIVVEDFQSDIPTIQIKGTTGFNPTGTVKGRGINKIREMKRFLEAYADMGGNGDKSPQDFYFHNHTNKESFVVHLTSDGVTFTQDVQSPLTFKYEISFQVLRKASEPAESDVNDPDIGNRQPSTPSYSPKPSPSPNRPNTGGSSSGGGTSLPSTGIQRPSFGGVTLPGIVTTPRTSSINPQVPSIQSSQIGRNGLGSTIGYNRVGG